MRAAPALSPGECYLRLPKVSDPSVWGTFALSLYEPWRLFQQPQLGWTVTFLRTHAGQAAPSVTPNTLPLDAPVTYAEAVCPIVILPESSGHKQYLVPVMEHFRWAQLQTPEWTVVFLKATRDLAAKRSGCCGSHG